MSDHAVEPQFVISDFIEVLRTLTAELWEAWVVALFAAASQLSETSRQVFPPLLWVFGPGADTAAARTVLAEAFENGDVHVRALLQTTLNQLFTTKDFLKLDLTDAHAGIASHLFQLLSMRRVPRGVIALVGPKGDPIHGGCAALLREDLAGRLESIGVVVSARSIQDSCDDLVALGNRLGGVRPAFKNLVSGYNPALPSGPIAHHGALDPTKARGYAFLERFAAHLDQRLPGARFLESLRSARTEDEVRSKSSIPDSRRRAVLAARLLEAIDGKEAYDAKVGGQRDDAKAGGHREDLLANIVRSEEGELFPRLDSLALGLFLRRWRIGSVDPYGRKAFPGDIKKGEGKRIFRRYVVFSPADRVRLRELAGPEYCGGTSLARWVVNRFGRQTVTFEAAKAELKASGQRADADDLFEVLESLPNVSRPGVGVYDLTNVVMPQGEINETSGEAPPHGVQ